MTYIQIEKHDLNGMGITIHGSPYLSNGSQITRIQLNIIFYPSFNLVDLMRQKVKEGTLEITNWYDMCLDGLDIDEDLEALKIRLSKLGFNDFEAHKQTIDTDIDNLLNRFIVSMDVNRELSNSQIGFGFLIISCEKKIK